MADETITAEDLAKHLKSIVDEGFEIDPPALVRLKGWNDVLLQVLMAKHFLAALSSAPTKLGDMDSLFSESGYFIAFLTTYGKCFTRASGYRVSLDSKDAFKGQPDEVRNAHERIMDLRNTYAAHNVDSGLVVSTIAAKGVQDALVVRHIITSALPLGELDAYKSAIDALETYVVKRLNSRLDKIERELGKTIEIE